MGKTRRVHSTGRFGSRYGVGIRKRVLKVEMEQKEKQTCPECSLGVLKRKAAGVYFCTKCKKEFAGGAYVPETMTGSLIKKMVSQKQFSSEILEEEPKQQPFSEKKLDQTPFSKKGVTKTTPSSKKEKLITKAKSVLGIEKKEPKKEEKQPLNLLEKQTFEKSLNKKFSPAFSKKAEVEQKTEKKERKE